MKNGIHLNLSHDDYDAVMRARWSRVRNILDCPAAFIHSLHTAHSESQAKGLGSLVHAAVLEPETVDRDYFRAEKVDRRTKAGKAAWAEQQALAESKTMLDAATYDQGLDLSQALVKVMNESLPGWRKSRKEVAVLSTMWGVAAKCRIDLIHEGQVWDIKTTRNLSPRAFMSACARYSYYGQLASYAKMLGNYEKGTTIGGLIAIQTQGAPVAHVIPFSDEAKAYGRSQAEQAWKLFAKCREANKWPGYDYSGGLGIPEWIDED